jgi:RNA polymerase sigma-70 factor (sigma-E family)
MARSPRWEPEFCEFFAARQRPFMRTAYAMLGSWPAAEDATQHTFTALYTHWPRIQPERLEAYARRTLVNACIATYRTRGREVLTDQPPEPDRGQDGESDETRVVLMGVLSGLPVRDRAVLALRFLDDLPVAEVAEILEVPEGTVKSQTSRALSRLHLAMTEPVKGHLE